MTTVANPLNTLLRLICLFLDVPDTSNKIKFYTGLFHAAEQQARQFWGQYPGAVAIFSFCPSGATKAFLRKAFSPATERTHRNAFTLENPDHRNLPF